MSQGNQTALLKTLFNPMWRTTLNASRYLIFFTYLSMQPRGPRGCLREEDCCTMKKTVPRFGVLYSETLFSAGDSQLQEQAMSVTCIEGVSHSWRVLRPPGAEVALPQGCITAVKPATA